MPGRWQPGRGAHPMADLLDRSRNIAVLSLPALWDLEQLVPSTPSPLDNSEALVAQLARA